MPTDDAYDEIGFDNEDVGGGSTDRYKGRKNHSLGDK